MAAKNFQEITFCISQAEELEAEAEKLLANVDYLRWRAAQLICEELANGTTQRALAAGIGRSQTLVSLMAKVWRRFGERDYPGNQRPRFQDAYRHVQINRPKGLDGLVPLPGDSDDIREGKIALMSLGWQESAFWKDTDKVLEGMPPEDREEFLSATRSILEWIIAWLEGDEEKADRLYTEAEEKLDRAIARFQ